MEIRGTPVFRRVRIVFIKKMSSKNPSKGNRNDIINHHRFAIVANKNDEHVNNKVTLWRLLMHSKFFPLKTRIQHCFYITYIRIYIGKKVLGRGHFPFTFKCNEVIVASHSNIRDWKTQGKGVVLYENARARQGTYNKNRYCEFYVIVLTNIPWFSKNIERICNVMATDWDVVHLCEYTV